MIKPQDITNHCKNCSVIADFEKNYENNHFRELDNARRTCANCRCHNGIYKFDAIYTALKIEKKLEKQKNNLTPGRKPTAYKKYGFIVDSLRKDGKTIREIAKVTKL